VFSDEQVEAILNADLEEALERFNRVRRSCTVPAGSKETAIPEHADAMNALMRALRRHSDFILNGIVPDDLK
jgi:hypothetical protein